MSTPTVVADRFDRTVEGYLRRSIVTPEGVPLVFTIAPAGDRVGAVLLDYLAASAVVLVLGLLFGIFGIAAGGTWMMALFLLLAFVVRNGYFVFFELRWGGRTPGKRSLGLRVIDGRGRQLDADAVVVRNLTREVELFVPLAALADPSLVVTDGPGWVRGLAVLWLGVFLVFPMLNRERRRIGDLLAGTLVVREPRIRLEPDVSERSRGETLEFTAAQLALYGVYELQVLEEVLREPVAAEAIETVARSIKKKIDWQDRGRAVDSRTFLEAFYRAQRLRLEHDLLLGHARERKRKGRLGGAAQRRER